MKNNSTKQSKFIRNAILIITGLLIVILGIVLYNRINKNISRMLAFRHLCQNQTIRRKLHTRSIPPRQVLESFPQTQNVLGTIEHHIRFFTNITDLRKAEIYVARLSGPNVNETDLDALTKFPELEYIEFVNTNISEDNLDKLRGKLPKCEIIAISE